MTTLVLVWPEVETTDDLGNVERRPAFGPPVAIPALHLFPNRVRDALAPGQTQLTQWTGLFRKFPAGGFSHVEFDGQQWEVSGGPERRRGSNLTRHVTVQLRAIGGEPIEW